MIGIQDHSGNKAALAARLQADATARPVVQPTHTRWDPMTPVSTATSHDCGLFLRLEASTLPQHNRRLRDIRQEDAESLHQPRRAL